MPPDAAVAAKASRKAGGAKPALPEAADVRPRPALTVPKRVSPSASVPKPGAPTAPVARKRTAAHLGATKELDKKAAEKAVADVIALIGQHLMMGVDVTRAEQGTPKAGARDVWPPLKPAAGSGLRTPTKRKPAVGAAKRRKATA